MRKLNITCDGPNCGVLLPSIKDAIVVSETKIEEGAKPKRVTKDYCSDKCLKEDRGYTEVK
jgi:hypothetical protein